MFLIDKQNANDILELEIYDTGGIDVNHLTLFFIIEIIGTVAFACSGATVAIQKHLDLLGVVVVGVITAVGGGMIRDIIIGNNPPNLFKNPVYVLAAFISVMVLFLFVRFRCMSMEVLTSVTYDRIMSFLDAIGLGAFTVVGIDTAIDAGYGEYYFLMIFLGVITGVGGGILRDMMVCEIPSVLRRHIYACASLVGALCYVYLMEHGSRNVALIVSALLVVVIRVLARHYKWNLPKAM